jgi:hypothetical protein
LVGGSSVSDHGEFAFPDYIGHLPFVSDPGFIDGIAKVVKERGIDIIYPTMDSVILALVEGVDRLGCALLSPKIDTVRICSQKLLTYEALRCVLPVPRIFINRGEITKFPVFVKPNVGYGARGAYRADTQEELLQKAYGLNDPLICEYLPGEELTVDCFTDYTGTLRFCRSRKRMRVLNGVSVRSEADWADHPELIEWARAISTRLSMRGAWFFQMKRRENGTLVLLEVACRIGGGAGTYRAAGVNLPLLSLYDAFQIPVGIDTQPIGIVRDASIVSKYKLDISYSEVYIDLDDCLLVDGKVNVILLQFIYQCINSNKSVYLLTRHDIDPRKELEKARLLGFWDGIFHIGKDEKKSSRIRSRNSIFIDDSFSERREVREALGIPVFSLDAIECLLDFPS